MRFLRSSVVIRKKNGGVLEPLPPIPLTCFLEVFQIISRTPVPRAAASASRGDEGMLLCEQSSSGSQPAAAFISSPRGVSERSLMPFTCKTKAGGPRAPPERPLPPMAQGVVGKSQELSRLCAAFFVQPEPHQRRPNCTGNKEVPTWEQPRMGRVGALLLPAGVKNWHGKRIKVELVGRRWRRNASLNLICFVKDALKKCTMICK